MSNLHKIEDRENNSHKSAIFTQMTCLKSNRNGFTSESRGN